MKKKPPIPTFAHSIHTIHGMGTVQIPETERGSHLPDLMQCFKCEQIVYVTTPDMLPEFLCNGCLRDRERRRRVRRTPLKGSRRL